MRQPNIVFILTDQQRGDCLSASGHPVVQTPNLDMLAGRGVNFTASYSCCPSCIAARASFFTGQRPTTHGRLGYQDGVPWRYTATLPGELRKAGYQTYCVGKTHFYPQGARLGFDWVETYEGAQNFDGRFVSDYLEWLRERTGQIGETLHGVDWNAWTARPSHLPEEFHNNTWVVTRGIEFLRRRDRTCPFFLNLSFHRPHAPLDPPQAFWDLYKDRPLPPVPMGDWAARHDMPVTDVNAWQGRLAPAQLDAARRAYYAQIAHIDSQIGRFLIALREQHAGPTWVLFTSDHGEMLGDHCLFRKTYAYEGSARTPCILCPPRGEEIGRICDAPVSQEDFMPTMLEIAGAPIPSSVEGRSLLPLIAKTPKEANWREYMHGEHTGCYSAQTGMQFLTDGREKYIWFTKSGEEQFFDLTADPQELHNLAGVAAKRDRLELWRGRMVRELASRVQDGLSDGKRLIAGKELPHVRAELLSHE